MAGDDFLELRALEPRIMFDGAGAITSAEIINNDSATLPVTTDLTSNVELKKSEQKYSQIAFVDTSTNNYQSLVKSISPYLDIVLLDPNRDGVDQIANYVDGKSGIKAIHILSHGSDAKIKIASTELSLDNVEKYNMSLSAIGDTMAMEGDILFYGCDITKSSAGINLINFIGSATGADIAASNDKTGSMSLGGDWNLETKTGNIETIVAVNNIQNTYYGILGTPAISDGGSTGYIKDASAINITSSIAIANGSTYGGGSLTVAITSADSSETLSFNKVDAAAVTNGEISIVNSLLYLGNGSTADQIGVIDSTNDGTNGKTLQIDFISDAFTNPSFETNDFTGWTADTSNQVDLGTSNIAGIATPNDSSDPTNSGGDSDVPTTKGTWTATIKSNDKTSGSYALQLKSVSMTTQNGYDVVHGPSIYSDTFEAENGQVIKFDWRALGGSDAYDVFGYIVNTGTNATTEILNETGSSAAGSTDWATADVTIPADGDYRFVFVAGTYDFTGGKAAGASLYIDNIQVYGDLVTDAVLQDIARLVTYKTTATTLSAADRASRTATFTATATDGNSGNATAEIFETTETEEVFVAAPTKVISALPAEYSPPKPAPSSEMFTIVSGSPKAESQTSAEMSAQQAPRPISESTQSQNTPTLTSAGQGRFQVVVLPNDSGTASMLLNQGMTDKIFKSGSIKFQIPIDTFAHSDPEANVRVLAKSADGQALPAWLIFDARSGTFTGEAPPGLEGAIEIIVTATDAEGREAATKFKLFVGGDGAESPSEPPSELPEGDPAETEAIPDSNKNKSDTKDPEASLKSKINFVSREDQTLKKSGKLSFTLQLAQAKKL